MSVKTVRELVDAVVRGHTPRVALRLREDLQEGDAQPLNPRAYDTGSVSPAESAADKRHFTRDEALAVLRSLGADDRADLEQFRQGMEVEWEHAKTVDFDLAAIGRIVLDHLGEDPEYYTKLNAAGLEGRLKEGAEASDLVGLKGHLEGPYALGGSEETAWKQAFDDYSPGRVVAAFDDGNNEVSKLVKQVFKSLDTQKTITVDGQTRTFGLYQGVKFMLDPDNKTASFDVGDRGFVKKLSEDFDFLLNEDFVDLAKMEPAQIKDTILGWAHGDKSKADYMLDGYIKRATATTKPKFLVAQKLLKA